MSKNTFHTSGTVNNGLVYLLLNHTEQSCYGSTPQKMSSRALQTISQITTKSTSSANDSTKKGEQDEAKQMFVSVSFCRELKRSNVAAHIYYGNGLNRFKKFLISALNNAGSLVKRNYTVLKFYALYSICEKV